MDLLSFVFLKYTFFKYNILLFIYKSIYFFQCISWQRHCCTSKLALNPYIIAPRQQRVCVLANTQIHKHTEMGGTPIRNMAQKQQATITWLILWRQSAGGRFPFGRIQNLLVYEIQFIMHKDTQIWHNKFMTQSEDTFRNNNLQPSRMRNHKRKPKEICFTIRMLGKAKLSKWRFYDVWLWDITKHLYPSYWHFLIVIKYFDGVINYKWFTSW